MAYAAIVRYHKKIGPMPTVHDGKLWSYKPRWELLAIARTRREARHLGFHELWNSRGFFRGFTSVSCVACSFGRA